MRNKARLWPGFGSAWPGIFVRARPLILMLALPLLEAMPTKSHLTLQYIIPDPTVSLFPSLHPLIKAFLTQKIKMASKKSLPPDSIFKYLSKREKVACTKLDESAKEAFCARRLPMVWKERALPVGELDKIFSSTWLDGNNVICGTKCNTVSEYS